MKNGRLIAAQQYLRAEGYTIPDDILLHLFTLMNKQSETIYEKDDFVMYYEGMGESWYGTVIGKSGSNYKIQTWKHSPESNSYVTTVCEHDMRGLATEEDAKNYHRIRAGADV